MKPGPAANKDPKITAIRKARTDSENRYGIGGMLKRKLRQRRYCRN